MGTRLETRLGPYNLSLVACYFVPAWGAEAVNALTSPYAGLTDPVHAGAAIRLRELLDLPDGLMLAANLLAGFKLVVVASLVAYVIEFARAVLTERAPDRGTINTVLVFTVAAVAIFIMPALAFEPAAATQAHVAQLLLVAGALIVITIERHVEEIAVSRVAPALARDATAGSETPAPHY